jgi:sugar/nucleoside kinase (ribokinase family)
MNDAEYPAVLVGTIALDLLHNGLTGSDLSPVILRWGGVVGNMACAMGALGMRPLFVSADYTGEMRAAVAQHLDLNGVSWERLDVRAPLPLFHARLGLGDITEEHFIGEDALRVITPGRLSRRRDLFAQAAAIVSCTDLDIAALDWLAEIAVAWGLPFWLLSSDPAEVGKLRLSGAQATCVALNLRELVTWAGQPLSTRQDICATARRLVHPAGRCLVTMGTAGALLVADDGQPELFQPAPTLDETAVTVGAGDIMFGCLLSGKLRGLAWPDAMADAIHRVHRYLRSSAADGRPYHELALTGPLRDRQ